ncbi:MAG TPA: hypothetical protein VFX70_14090 [Mycobacteriales bacterium]|nr:hypothetical protein [Mycobacteriales bacterium]
MHTKVRSPDPGPATAVRLGRVARSWRLAATALVLALLFAGTLWGSDSDFPLGPFRMYSTRDSPNAPVATTQIEATTAAGGRVSISGPETGLRRAEVEGQLGRFVGDPALLESLAAAYQRHHPGSVLTQVEVVRRDYSLRRGRATGAVRTTVLAAWSRR